MVKNVLHSGTNGSFSSSLVCGCIKIPMFSIKCIHDEAGISCTQGNNHTCMGIIVDSNIGSDRQRALAVNIRHSILDKVDPKPRST